MTTPSAHHANRDRLTNARQHWREIAHDLEQKIDELQQRLSEANANLQHLDAAAALCDALETASPNQYGIHSHIDPATLADYDTIRNAGRRVAQLTDGKLKLSDASRLLFAIGRSDAKDFSGIKSNLHGMVSASDEWEKDDDEVYRLLTYRPENEPQDEQEEEPWPDESSTTGSGAASPLISPDDAAPWGG